MKMDQFFGLLLILLAIYLGVTATTGGDLDGGLFSQGDNGSVDGGGAGTDDGGSKQRADGGKRSGDRHTHAHEHDGEVHTHKHDVDDDDHDHGHDGRASTSGSNGSNGSNDSEAVIIRSDFCAAAPQRSAYSDLGRANDAAIRCVDAAGIMTGTSATQFDPAAAVTRGQAADAVAAMIDKANELEAKDVELRDLPPADDARFEDVTADTPHELAIARLNETPVLQGYVDARYEPRGKVTRAQMASMLDRAYQYMNSAALPIGRDRFRDDEQSVHEESINSVAGADIMHGVGNRRFAPRRSVRRGELASYLTRMMIRMEDKDRILPLSDTPTK
ncbi:MAG: S-layer homology domain-containing protein [Actinobacteria bacterium]|nr:S-layer homology domain-containing protein [Actinomycetota bacterium]